jgi:peptidoglycan hydrolase CwlO-like protein
VCSSDLDKAAQLDDLEKQVHDKAAQVDDLEKQVHDKAAKISDLGRQIDDKDRAIRDRDDHLRQSQSSDLTGESRIRDLQTELKEAAAKLSAQGDLDREHQATIARQKSEILSRDNQIAKLAAVHEEELAAVNREIARLRAVASDESGKTRIGELESDIDDLRSKLKRTSGELRERDDRIDELEQHIAQLKDEPPKIDDEGQTPPDGTAADVARYRNGLITIRTAIITIANRRSGRERDEILPLVDRIRSILESGGTEQDDSNVIVEESDSWAEFEEAMAFARQQRNRYHTIFFIFTILLGFHLFSRK